MLLSFVTVFLIFGSASAACDNQCSGHGTCMTDDVCKCYDNWGVGLSHDSGDCSQRVCPFELAWVDAPNKVGEFHKYAECAGRGICNRDTAECVCFDGYEGKACQRTTCPNDCSGHGTCEYIEDMGYGSTWSDYSNDYHYYYARYVLGSGPPSGYHAPGQGFFDDKALFVDNDWDNRKTRGCVCDALYGDLDCSKRMCPYGTDVLDNRDNLLVSAKYQTQRINFYASTGTVETNNQDWDDHGHVHDGAGAVHDDDNLNVRNGLSAGEKASINQPARRLTNTNDDNSKNDDKADDVFAEPHLAMHRLRFQTFALTFRSKLNETFTTIPIVFNHNDMPNFIHDVQLALLNLPNKVIDGVTVAGARTAASIVHINVTFTGDRVQGPQHYLIVEDYECQDGCTPKMDGLKLQTRVDHLNSNIQEWVREDPVYIGGNGRDTMQAVNGRAAISSDYNSYECGRRGSCDYTTGLCACFTGYTGANCNTLTTLV